eukprot:TRINITY_DN17646_c0_g1_i2.p1 TRINITY_DN17646_c0_g1~~TRINITY_DN17646_c0_g1_i2.p1  ORF type:complete len:201 (-),score=25.12 TRINITY_DN17646_c0_g1_i2:19-621(-)
MAFFEATLSRGSVFTSKFLDSQTGGKPLQQTTISVYHSTEGFHVEFVAEDSKIESNFTSHNDPLWKEDVCELFIAVGVDTPQRYLECELSPNGICFLAWVTNASGTCGSHLTLEFLDPLNTPGFKFGAQRFDAEQRWTASFCIPWALLHDAKGSNVIPSTLRFNAFRHEVAGPEFTALVPTLRNPPCFHVPSVFVVGKLV